MGPDQQLVTVPDPGLSQLRELERRENFPVAMRALPRALRDDLRAVYDVARFIDDLGDDPRVDVADRLQHLDLVDRDLRAAFDDGSPPRLDVVRRLVPAARRRGLTTRPFLDLVQANRLDQTVTRYPSYDDLLRYCSLSANPVGRLVLQVFGVADPAVAARSDAVCTALQVLEHCQDVAEDLQTRDRIYLPLEDLHRFGVDEADLRRPSAAAPVRRLVAFEVDRAERLLRDGAAIVGSLRGWSRVAVGGYVAGGLATVDALRRADHDVLAVPPRPRRLDVARHLARLLGSRR